MANKSQSKRTQPVNFLEALRDLGQGVTSEAKVQIKNIVTDDIPESFGFPTSGTLHPNESFSPHKKEAYENSYTSSRLMQVKEEEQAQLRRNEAQLREQITSLQQEIRKLASSMGEFAQEVQAATSQAVINPGIYHKNFFHQLRSVIVTMQKRVNESKHWLAECNSRGKKKSYYWSNVQKSGTSYMLSSERYMVTSTG